MMTYSLLFALEDLKVLIIREGIANLCPPGFGAIRLRVTSVLSGAWGT